MCKDKKQFYKCKKENDTFLLNCVYQLIQTVYLETTDIKVYTMLGASGEYKDFYSFRNHKFEDFFTPSGVQECNWIKNEEFKMKQKALIQSNLAIPTPKGFTATPEDKLDKTKFGAFKDSEDVVRVLGTHDSVENPKGYDKKISPIEYIEANKLSFTEGNIVKYVTRHKEKGGAEDIKKIIKYAKLILKYEYNIDNN